MQHVLDVQNDGIKYKTLWFFTRRKVGDNTWMGMPIDASRKDNLKPVWKTEDTRGP